MATFRPISLRCRLGSNCNWKTSESWKMTVIEQSEEVVQVVGAQVDWRGRKEQQVVGPVGQAAPPKMFDLVPTLRSAWASSTMIRSNLGRIWERRSSAS